MLLTAQQKLEFKPEDQPAMDRRLRNYTFTSLPNQGRKPQSGFGNTPGVCRVGFDKSASVERPRRKLRRQFGRRSRLAIGDGILKDEEKDALRTLPLSDVWTDPPEETGETASAVEDSGSLRHRQLAIILQTRVGEREERIRREQQLHRLRRDSLIARGVPREHADLLPVDDSEPLPTQLNDDLAMLRQNALEEEMESRKRKAKEAFESRWLRETEKELHDCVEKCHRARDPFLSANMQAYREVLCNKLKLHHQSQGTYNTAEAIEERRRVCTELGILREQD
ncbi:hypothetical protein OS493_022884 [Desmophyllum pertusum]|uniref:Uncharacterized protein n=1 Tax=Desmophyllum pertusum TaxID=174260 RepID=A0A9X0D202_9CNID|nr:hypothetical protein OS493_022884 [Desmophyllum pertusum]